MNEIQQLAQDVLEMFAAQADYFKSRNPEQLTKCKQIEGRLKKRCREILDPSKKTPGLFGE